MDGNWKEYRDTGMLGAYHPKRAVNRRTEDGMVETTFRDTMCHVNEDEFVEERKMLIGGKCFHITSVFLDAPTGTPTDKLLALIDTELEKKNHSA